VPGHTGIDGKEMADQLARQGFVLTRIRPEPALGISAKVARGVIRGWVNKKLESIGSLFLDKDRLKASLKDSHYEYLVVDGKADILELQDVGQDRGVRFGDGVRSKGLHISFSGVKIMYLKSPLNDSICLWLVPWRILECCLLQNFVMILTLSAL
jgi:hypothetical protein